MPDENQNENDRIGEQPEARLWPARCHQENRRADRRIGQWPPLSRLQQHAEGSEFERDRREQPGNINRFHPSGANVDGFGGNGRPVRELRKVLSCQFTRNFGR